MFVTEPDFTRTIPCILKINPILSLAIQDFFVIYYSLVGILNPTL
jgi:hypothetical protein